MAGRRLTPRQIDRLARELRESFARTLDKELDGLVALVQVDLDDALSRSIKALPVDLRVAMEAGSDFSRVKHDWLEYARDGWDKAQLWGSERRSQTSPLDELSLEADGAAEAKIMGARGAAAILEQLGQEWNDLQARVRRLENAEELESDDPLRPEIYVRVLFEAWAEAGMRTAAWPLIAAPLQKHLGKVFSQAYQDANELLADAGISAEMELKAPGGSSRFGDEGGVDGGTEQMPLTEPGGAPTQMVPPGYRGGGMPMGAPHIPGYPQQHATGGMPGGADDAFGAPTQMVPPGYRGRTPAAAGQLKGGGTRSAGGTSQRGRYGALPGNAYTGGAGVDDPLDAATQMVPPGYRGGASRRGRYGVLPEGAYTGHPVAGDPARGATQWMPPGDGSGHAPQQGRYGAWPPEAYTGVGEPAPAPGAADSLRRTEVPVTRIMTPEQLDGGISHGEPHEWLGDTGITRLLSVRASALARVAQETRAITGLSPMVRQMQRSQGVWGQMRGFIADQIDAGEAQWLDAGGPVVQSPALVQALQQPAPAFVPTRIMAETTRLVGVDTGDVRFVAAGLRQHAEELKEKADRPSEKAIIEVVAQMFQAILAESRIAPGIRVWFARLQMPVLRLALQEPEFFAQPEHPARSLIDRMGAFALGFEGPKIAGDELEREIKRVVQMIEQYPETGSKVYAIVLKEFEQFIGTSLVGDEHSPAGTVISLAKRVEQKEALGVSYTIELRKQVQSLPISEEVRQFLYRIWSEVLALETTRSGVQSPETKRLKKVATDLVWTASAQVNREVRGKVLQRLPGLLAALRDGMALIGMDSEEQEEHIKLINGAIKQAFASGTEGLTQSQFQRISQALEGLEDVVSDDARGDIMLDPGVVELMFGEDSGSVEVIATGGSAPSQAMLQWAASMELGLWCALDHQERVTRVQYVWRSPRGQLHLFMAGSERSYLVQTRRLASYLQAGLLVPVADEALTVMATRVALEKLQASPADLLH